MAATDIIIIIGVIAWCAAIYFGIQFFGLLLAWSIEKRQEVKQERHRQQRLARLMEEYNTPPSTFLEALDRDETLLLPDGGANWRGLVFHGA